MKTRIFLQQEEYIDSLSNNVGLKVVVHDFNDVPFPEEEGFGIQPGKVNEVGVTRVSQSFKGRTKKGKKITLLHTLIGY